MVASYVDWARHNQDLNPTTIRSYLGGIITVHRLKKLKFPGISTLIDLQLKGQKAHMPTQPLGEAIVPSDWWW